MEGRTEHLVPGAIPLSGKMLAGISNIVDRSQNIDDASVGGKYLDLVLPSDACVFMTDMIGATNNNIGLFFT